MEACFDERLLRRNRNRRTHSSTYGFQTGGQPDGFVGRCSTLACKLYQMPTKSRHASCVLLSKRNEHKICFLATSGAQTARNSTQRHTVAYILQHISAQRQLKQRDHERLGCDWRTYSITWRACTSVMWNLATRSRRTSSYLSCPSPRRVEANGRSSADGCAFRDYTLLC